MIQVKREVPIAIVQLNRPEVLNALNPELMKKLVDELEEIDRNEPPTQVIIITGNEKAFAAGADIREMASLSAKEIQEQNPLGIWGRVYNIKKPLIAAVSGYCLGGGCELAMMCDMIVASETARFGQPEITLGIIPGAGGTQRLTLATGKGRAMEWILTGGTYSAEEAYRIGLVNKIVPVESCLAEAKKLALKIAAMPPLAVAKAKQAILQSFEGSLKQGLQNERHHFYSLFDTFDQKEGMKAFLEKRKPQFRGE